MLSVCHHYFRHYVSTVDRAPNIDVNPQIETEASDANTIDFLATEANELMSVYVLTNKANNKAEKSAERGLVIREYG